jgi:DNA-binding ferritin-like protein (Dps family)
MANFLKKIIGDKKEWNKLEARAKALPSDYRVVYGEIQNYMWNLWRFSAGNDMGDFATLEDLLGLFEEGAANGKSVLEVTGEDVAAFCDELFHATEIFRNKLNRDIMQKLGKGNASK